MVFRNHPGDRLAGGLRFAEAAGAVLDDRFGAVLVGRLADGPHHGFTHRPAGRVADRLVVRFANGLAQRLAALAVMRFADGLADLVGVGLAVRFADRLAGGVGAFLVVRFQDLLVNGVRAILVMGFAHRMADGLRDLLHAGFLHGFEVRVRHVLHHGLVAGPADRFLNRLVLRLLHGLVAGLDLVTIGGLGDRLHDGFADGLIADVEPFFQHRVVHHLVRGPDVRVARREADLCVAARGRTASRPTQAPEPRAGIRRPEEGESRHGKVSAQADPHDNRLLAGINAGLMLAVPADGVMSPHRGRPAAVPPRLRDRTRLTNGPAARFVRGLRPHNP